MLQQKLKKMQVLLAKKDFLDFQVVIPPPLEHSCHMSFGIIDHRLMKLQLQQVIHKHKITTMSLF